MFNDKNSAQIKEATSETLDSTYDLLQASLSNLEEMTQFQFNAAKKFLESTSQMVKNMHSSRSPNDAYNTLGSLATQTMENCSDFYNMATEAQLKFYKSFENHLGTAQQSATKVAESFSLPNAFPDNSGEPFKSLINGANQALNTFSKTTSQMAEFANNNLKAATNATMNVVKKTSDAKNKSSAS